MIQVGPVLYPADGPEFLRQRHAPEDFEYPCDDYALLSGRDKRRARLECFAYGTGPYASVVAFHEEFGDRLSDL